MPLLHKFKAFKPIPPPSGLKPDDLLYHLELSDEVFADYDSFFERTIHLNSMIWTCAITGRFGLTFEEAKDSEKEALKSLEDFPEFLELPLLYLVHKHIYRGRIDEMVTDVLTVMKDRYFVGEEVQYVEGREKKLARVTSVRYTGPEMEYDGEKVNGEAFDTPSKTTATGRKSTGGSSKKKQAECVRMPDEDQYLYDIQILDEESSSDSSSSSDDDDDDGGRRTDVPAKKTQPKSLHRPSADDQAVSQEFHLYRRRGPLHCQVELGERFPTGRYRMEADLYRSIAVLPQSAVDETGAANRS